jgi:hypothetical protein
LGFHKTPEVVVLAEFLGLIEIFGISEPPKGTKQTTSHASTIRDLLLKEQPYMNLNRMYVHIQPKFEHLTLYIHCFQRKCFSENNLGGDLRFCDSSRFLRNTPPRIFSQSSNHHIDDSSPFAYISISTILF